MLKSNYWNEYLNYHQSLILFFSQYSIFAHGVCFYLFFKRMLFKSWQFFRIPLSSSCFLVFLSLSYSYWFVGLLKWIALGRKTNCVHFNHKDTISHCGRYPGVLSKKRYLTQVIPQLSNLCWSVRMMND